MTLISNDKTKVGMPSNQPAQPSGPQNEVGKLDIFSLFQRFLYIFVISFFSYSFLAINNVLFPSFFSSYLPSGYLLKSNRKKNSFDDIIDLTTLIVSQCHWLLFFFIRFFFSFVFFFSFLLETYWTVTHPPPLFLTSTATLNLTSLIVYLIVRIDEAVQFLGSPVHYVPKGQTSSQLSLLVRSVPQ